MLGFEILKVKRRPNSAVGGLEFSSSVLTRLCKGSTALDFLPSRPSTVALLSLAAESDDFCDFENRNFHPVHEPSLAVLHCDAGGSTPMSTFWTRRSQTCRNTEPPELPNFSI